MNLVSDNKIQSEVVFFNYFDNVGTYILIE